MNPLRVPPSVRGALSATQDCAQFIVERYPCAGYLGAAVPTATGFWILIEQLTKLAALVSIGIGIAVGILTWQVKRLQKKKIEAELAALSAPSAVGGSRSSASPAVDPAT